MSAGLRRAARSGPGDWAIAWMVGGALGAGAQPDRRQSSAHGDVRASEQLGEAGRVQRVMQAQQLVLLPAPSPSLAGRRRRCGRFDRKPRCAPADRLRGPTEALGHVLERAPARCQPHQALVVVCAPAPRVADQPELPRPCRHARRGALRQLAGDLGAGQRAGVAVANNRVLPLGPAAPRLRVMQAEMLSVQAQRIGRAAQAVRQRDEIAALAQADTDRLVLMSADTDAPPVRYPGASCAGREPAQLSDRAARREPPPTDPRPSRP